MEKVWKGRGWRAEDGVRRKEEGGWGGVASLTYFIGKRAVKRSRRPRSHGSRSRRLKSAAGHCCKQQLQAEERRSAEQEAQS